MVFICFYHFQKILGIFASPLCTIFWVLVGTLGRPLLELSSLKILPGGRGIVRRPGSPENAGGKDPWFDSRRSTPVQHILLDGEHEHKEDHKDDEDDKG